MRGQSPQVKLIQPAPQESVEDSLSPAVQEITPLETTKAVANLHKWRSELSTFWAKNRHTILLACTGLALVSLGIIRTPFIIQILCIMGGGTLYFSAGYEAENGILGRLILLVPTAGLAVWLSVIVTQYMGAGDNEKAVSLSFVAIILFGIAGWLETAFRKRWDAEHGPPTVWLPQNAHATEAPLGTSLAHSRFGSAARPSVSSSEI